MTDDAERLLKIIEADPSAADCPDPYDEIARLTAELARKDEAMREAEKAILDGQSHGALGIIRSALAPMEKKNG